MHCISYLHVSNFRGCKDAGLSLTEFTPLVGQNNAGKSTLLDSIRWVLKPSALGKKDFCDQNKPVVITATVEGVTPDILDLIPTQAHRTAIEPYVQDGVMWIRAVATGTTSASVKQQIWDVGQYSGEGMPQEWRDYPTGLPQAVKALLPEPLYIGAMDDIGEDLGKAKAGTTIKSLLDEIMGPVLEAHAELADALGKMKSVLSVDGDNRSSHLRDFDEKASVALGEFFPGLGLNLDLQVVDIKEFFKAGDLHVTDEFCEDRRLFDQIGTGAQRAIQMALVRYLADLRAGAQQTATRRVLLIDEPELYLHPQAAARLRNALKTLSVSGFQVVFATHSPMMLSRDNAVNTVIVRKTKDDGTSVRIPLGAAVKKALDDAPAQAHTLFELGNLSDIYFSERVVLCEGKTDRRLLPLAYECLYSRTPATDGISFISLGSCADIPKTLPVLEAMGISVVAVADLDFAYTHARKGNKALLPKDGEDLVQMKAVLARLSEEGRLVLSEEGLPKNAGDNGPTASEAWKIAAEDSGGQALAEQVHRELAERRVWVWPAGCIEDVIGCDSKGESAISAQEQRFLTLSAEEFTAQMEGLTDCLDWIRS